MVQRATTHQRLGGRGHQGPPQHAADPTLDHDEIWADPETSRLVVDSVLAGNDLPEIYTGRAPVPKQLSE